MTHILEEQCEEFSVHVLEIDDIYGGEFIVTNSPYGRLIRFSDGEDNPYVLVLNPDGGEHLGRKAGDYQWHEAEKYRPPEDWVRS